MERIRSTKAPQAGATWKMGSDSAAMEVPETFQCYLTTAIGNPHLLPEVTTNVTESARACS